MIRPTLQLAPIAVNAFFRGFRVKIVTYTVPAFLVLYFMYGDTADMTNEEIAVADAFLHDNNLVDLVSAGEPYFSKFHDVPCILAGDVVDACLLVDAIRDEYWAEDSFPELNIETAITELLDGASDDLFPDAGEETYLYLGVK